MADRFRIQNNLETLRDFSAPGEEGTTRLSYTPAYRQAVDYLKKEMEAAGLQTWEDGVGNVYGELKGTDETAPVILSGSHLDTVRCSGYFDGQAGIVCALEAARMLKESGKPLRSSFQVLATIMEEGARFPNLTGSRYIAGENGEAQLDTLRDQDGVTLREAIRQCGFSGNLEMTCRKADSIKAFLELHLEQGIRLESTHTDLGIVETIYGCRWFTVAVNGATSHPSTPMNLRKDAGIAACTLISELAALVEEHYPNRATVTFGKFENHPNEINAVPGRTVFSVDFRSGKPEILNELEALLKEKLKAMESRFRVKTELTLYSDVPPTPCCAEFSKILEEQAAALHFSTLRMDSGAGHDAMIFAKHWPAAMIFVPSHNGLTHCPKEWTDYGNLAKGADVLCAAIRQIDKLD